MPVVPPFQTVVSPEQYVLDKERAQREEAEQKKIEEFHNLVENTKEHLLLILNTIAEKADNSQLDNHHFNACLCMDLAKANSLAHDLLNFALKEQPEEVRNTYKFLNDSFTLLDDTQPNEHKNKTVTKNL